MTDYYLLLTPILMLAIVALFAFVGCVHSSFHLLPPMTGLAATPGDMRVDLSWDPYPNATTYKLRRDFGGTYEIRVIDPSETTYTDHNVTNGLTYGYTVFAIVSSNEVTEPSDYVYATPMVPEMGSFFFVKSRMLGSYSSSPKEWTGMEIHIGDKSLSVSKLGRIFGTGNVQQHAVRIINKGTNVVLTTALIDTIGGTNGAFQYADVSPPVTLLPYGYYYIVGREIPGGDYSYQDDSTIEPTGNATVISAVSGDGVNPYEAGAPGNHCFGPLDFYYTIVP